MLSQEQRQQATDSLLESHRTKVQGKRPSEMFPEIEIEDSYAISASEDGIPEETWSMAYVALEHEYKSTDQKTGNSIIKLPLLLCLSAPGAFLIAIFNYNPMILFLFSS